MELEFDKEIDAILRKAREPVGAAVAVSGHLDADAVAAFAENALPQKARLLYMEHFADCDHCRKQLTYAISNNAAADATTADSYATAAAVETVVPWYRSLFRTPNLAMAMGALVLAFSGVLGYLVLQNRNSEVSVSQVNDKQIPSVPNSAAEPVAAANANAAAANTLAPAANTAAMPNQAANSVANATGSGAAGTTTRGPGQPESEGYAVDGVDANQPKPITAAPPPAPEPADKPDASRDERKAETEKQKEENKDLSKEKQESDDRMARESVPSAAKKTGPNRASGPRQNQQNQTTDNTYSNQTSAGMVSDLKTAGGKKFENRNGAWYDTAYHGQATTNVRRGTDEFKKLDGGLRSIANSIGGTVVVVWKDKAYRIN